MNIRNRHPADELADLRAQLRPFMLRAQKLRARLLAMPESERRADSWYGKVSTYKIKRLHRKAMQKELGLEVLRPFMREKSHERLDLVKNRTGK